MYNKLFIAGLLASKASAAMLPGQMGALQVRDDTYNCHANCGYAILEIEDTDDICSDETFLEDYANCLICAGSDNDGIWEYYGESLTSVAASCGLATTPATGTQTDVGTAIVAGSTETATAASAAATTTSASETTSSTSSASAAASASSTATATASAATSTSTAGAPGRPMAAGLAGVVAMAAYAAVY